MSTTTTGPKRDVIDIVVGFARTLRHAGVPASPDGGHAMIEALGHFNVLVPADVYWAGRLTLCGDPADLDRYDAAFRAYFHDQDYAEPARRARVRQLGAARLEIGTS